MLVEIEWPKHTGPSSVQAGHRVGPANSRPYFAPVFDSHRTSNWRSPFMPRCLDARSIPFLRLDNRTAGHQWHHRHPSLSALVVNKIRSIPHSSFWFCRGGSSWLPSMFEMSRSQKSKGQLNDWRFFITARRTKDLPYLINIFGDENLIVGTDYSHSDGLQCATSTEHL